MTSSAVDKMFEIFGPIFEQNANVNFKPIGIIGSSHLNERLSFELDTTVLSFFFLGIHLPLNIPELMRLITGFRR